jgi:hypothetical protein
MTCLERKGFVEVLTMIGAGALLVGGYAVYYAGREALKWWAKEKFLRAFETEEQTILRRIAELDRIITLQERHLDEPIVDWRGRDASGEVRAEIEMRLRERTELESRLEAVQAAREEVERMPTDEDGKHIPGAHMIYR